MMLSGEEYEQLTEALLSAFVTEDELRRMLRIRLEKSLDELTASKSLRERVGELCDRAEAEGWIEELVRGARREKPHNAKLASLAARVLGEAAALGAAGPEEREADIARRFLAEKLEAVSARRRRLVEQELPTEDVDREILAVRRELRAGGQLGPGDELGDGRYVLVRRLGKGGFATVWEARDTARGERVAIKVLHPEIARDEDRRERFFRGARTMAALDHPAVTRVLEQRGEDDGWHYVVLELLTGGDLRAAVLKKGMRGDRVLRIVLRVGEAVIAAQDKGFIHRDIKPANVLLDAAGEPKLTDFDLVAARDSTGGTRTGAMGTFVYAAPELMDRPQDADARADVYGLGMTALFGLLGEELPMTVVRGADKVIAGLDCPDVVKRVLARAVEWEREARFPDARAFCDALREAVREEDEARARQAAKLAAAKEEEDRRARAAAEREASMGLPSAFAPPTARDEAVKAEAPPVQPLSRDRGAQRAVAGLLAGALALAGLAGIVVWKSVPVREARDAGTPVETASAPPQASISAELPPRVVPAATAATSICPAEMVLVPGGGFQMGSDDGDADEKPEHSASALSFCLDRTEVTVDAYSACVSSGDCSDYMVINNAADSRCNYKDPGRGNHPINCVGWSQASEYCTKQGKTLPTEDQWEYAARRGDQQRIYPWGNTPPSTQICWKSAGTCEVGAHEKGDSRWGAHDLAGNVAEWTDSRYCSYPSFGQPSSCSAYSGYVVRGGSWKSGAARGVRAAFRSESTTSTFEGAGDIGFRCAKVL